MTRRATSSPGESGGQRRVDGRSTDTAGRIVAAALALFAERGYEATSIADIEAAVGLRPGAGGLYRHFASKRDVLAAAVRSASEATAQAVGTVAVPEEPDRPLSERLAAIGRAGLGKLRAERDLTRLIFRDLDHFPDLLAEVLAGDVQPTYAALAAWLQANASDPSRDWEAIAAALGGAIANYWTVTHFLGEPPGAISEERFVAAWVAVASSVLASDAWE